MAALTRAAVRGEVRLGCVGRQTWLLRLLSRWLHCGCQCRVWHALPSPGNGASCQALR